jgi:hypothetical protein
MMSEFKKHFFNHDFYASQDDKIQKLYISLGGEGYGFYWMIIEQLHSNDGEIPEDYERLEYNFRCSGKANLLKSIVNDFDLFEVDDGIITCNRVLMQRDNIKHKSDGGRNAAHIRWENNTKKQLIRFRKRLDKDDEQMSEFKSMDGWHESIINHVERNLISKRKSVTYKKYIDKIRDEINTRIQQRQEQSNDNQNLAFSNK